MAEHVDSLIQQGTTHEIRRPVAGNLSVDVRNRMIVHTITDLAESLLRTPGVNARGLVATVTSEPITEQTPHPDFNVVVSAPVFF